MIEPVPIQGAWRDAEAPGELFAGTITHFYRFQDSHIVWSGSFSRNPSTDCYIETPYRLAWQHCRERGIVSDQRQHDDMDHIAGADMAV